MQHCNLPEHELASFPFADVTLERDPGRVVLGGGCFWCTEAVFLAVDGVTAVTSGYAGGHAAQANYRKVSAGSTGHAEVVQITFRPALLSYKDILRVFFTAHDPTTLNRQGADVGPQYRSLILYHSPDQHAAALAIIDEITRAALWPDPIVTEMAPYTGFYPAEEYHHRYYERNAAQPYCQIVIAPKVATVRSKYLDKLKNPAA